MVLGAGWRGFPGEVAHRAQMHLGPAPSDALPDVVAIHNQDPPADRKGDPDHTLSMPVSGFCFLCGADACFLLPASVMTCSFSRRNRKTTEKTSVGKRSKRAKRSRTLTSNRWRSSSMDPAHLTRRSNPSTVCHLALATIAEMLE